ncbi:hypothetical protein SADUNF_Sadunf18G0052500 [Salix dunnii]|uniref:Uncharacterized protein n=1 Tax=Salix dunnii TaxID=1413687 RepID=A0A835J3D3_9ROSI|nr:hypothetical protein SADUNF_Sadunf18G0052500 [Salix dunnii]
MFVTGGWTLIDLYRFIDFLYEAVLFLSLIEDPKGFKLEFFFDSNPYFKNHVLTKTYHMIDEDEPILEKAIGQVLFFYIMIMLTSSDYVFLLTEIEWYPGKCLTQKLLKKKPKKGSKNAKPVTKTEDCESFFNFFSPPQVPEDDEDIDEDTAEELQNQMEQDYDIGKVEGDKLGMVSRVSGLQNASSICHIQRMNGLDFFLSLVGIEGCGKVAMLGLAAARSVKGRGVLLRSQVGAPHSIPCCSSRTQQCREENIPSLQALDSCLKEKLSAWLSPIVLKLHQITCVECFGSFNKVQIDIDALMIIIKCNEVLSLTFDFDTVIFIKHILKVQAKLNNLSS